MANIVNDTVMVIGELNEPPIANAGPDITVEWVAEGTSVTLDGSLSTDSSIYGLTYTWTGPFLEGSGTTTGIRPVVTLPSIGTSDIRLSVDDGTDGSADDWVTVNVVDTTAPTIVVNLVPFVGDAGKHEGKSRRFIAEFSVIDNHDAAPRIDAVLVFDDWPNPIPVTNSQIIQYKLDDDVKVSLNEKEALKIRAPSLVLRTPEPLNFCTLANGP